MTTLNRIRGEVRDAVSAHQYWLESCIFGKKRVPQNQFDFGDDQTVLTRRLGCLWEDWFDFAVDMLGYDEWTSGPVLNRYLPQADPEVNGFYCLDMQLVDCAGKPLAADGLDTLQYVDASGSTQTQGKC
jgi:hypothetical protein